MDNRPIGMFDSGVGGLTVFKEIIKQMPNEKVIYIGDTASFPYGSKSKQTIIDLTKKQIENLIEKDVKLIIIACGTATSQALKEMRHMFSVPIIGIINPTIEYLKSKNEKKIGIIATTGTIRSKGWEEAIEQEIPDSQIQAKACPLLAPMAEEGWTQNEIAELTIKEYLKDIKNIDAIILGCTHYPLFEKAIRKNLPEKVEIINTGKTVAKYLKGYIKENNLEKTDETLQEHEIYLTDTECNFLNVAQNLLNIPEISNKISKI